jgi:vancomycin aglycone glucosyltransferase
MVGLAVQLRALQALRAAMPVCAPPDFAHRLACVGVPVVPVEPVGPIGQPMRPLVTRATPPSAADLPRRAAALVATQFDTVAAVAEGCDAPVPAMPAGGWL